MLDSDYNHTVNFNSKETQLNWFISKSIYCLNNNSYQRKSEFNIRVDKTLNELKNCNYCLIINEDNTKYFYFIMNKEYVNEYTTSLTLKLDLMQTYLFDIKFIPCLVDRQHIQKWTKFANGQKQPALYYAQEDEGLEIGEYEVNKITTLYDYSNKGSYIICSSEMLGESNEKRKDSGVSPR